MANDYQVKTVHGYDFFEVASAFQKSVRRGDETQSMFWAVELYESNYANYVWKRMIVMASEDVGLGDPFAIVQLMALKQSYDFLTQKKEASKPERLPFTHAVVMLTRSCKSRYIDHAITYYWHLNKEVYMDLPDYAYDMHTRKGKAMGRGLKYFYQESVKINNANRIPGEDEMEAAAMEVDKVAGVERIDISYSGDEVVVKSKSRKKDDEQTSLF